MSNDLDRLEFFSFREKRNPFRPENSTIKTESTALNERWVYPIS